MKRFFTERLVPANRTLGIRVLEVGPDSRSVVLRLPYRRRILNSAGTAHGAAIMALRAPLDSRDRRGAIDDCQ